MILHCMTEKYISLGVVFSIELILKITLNTSKDTNEDREIQLLFRVRAYLI